MLREFTASIQKQNFTPEQGGDVYDPDKRLKKEAMKKRVEARIAAKKLVSEDLQLKKIISGMQKNVDQYGIEAAKELGIDYGGTVNKGFKVVPEGSNSPNFQEFVDSGKWEEIESQSYPDRTKANAQNADGTVWFGKTGTDSAGHNATKKYSGNKPWIENPTDKELRQWLIDNNIETLNVAGNRSYGTEELGQQAKETIVKAVQGDTLTSSSSFETVKKYSVEDLRNNPNKIYIFGDNTEGWGKGGQAIVRDEPNAFGISTKDSPTQFMSDDNFEANKAKIDADIAAIKADGRPIVFPEDGIGTGRADLQNKAPRTWAYLQKELNKLRSGGSLGAAKLNDPNVFDEVIEEYTPGNKFIKEIVGNIPGWIIVPIEQAIESGLRMSGYSAAAALAKKLVQWELYTFAVSLGANAIGRGEGALVSPQLAQAHLILGNEEEFRKRAATMEKDMMQNSAEVGSGMMSAIIKAMPSYWKDEWLLKRNPEFTGWMEMFPDLAYVKTKAEKGIDWGIGKLFGNGK